MSDFATVTFYKVTTEAIGIISQMGALYRWLSPDYPEDLAFYREDGSCLFASISHERDAWFEGELSVNEIREHLPGLIVKEHHFHS